MTNCPNCNSRAMHSPDDKNVYECNMDDCWVMQFYEPTAPVAVDNFYEDSYEQEW